MPNPIATIIALKKKIESLKKNAMSKKLRQLTDAEVLKIYGKQGDTKNFKLIPTPYPMRIAWDTKVTVNKVQCHKLIADQLTNVFKELLCHYGLPKIQELGIDLFGGIYNFRLMRGSKTKWSRHSWAIAIDLSPEKNSLKTSWKNAQFSKPAYKPMVDIFYKHGFINYGVEFSYDSMHFEIGILK